MAKEPASAGMRYNRGDDERVDSLWDVPAAVLCAACGDAECPGCATAEDDASGVVAIVPWERPVAGVWTRLWLTARATTQGADAFFSALPDGDLHPAVRFAIIAELLAISAMLSVIVPLAALALPNVALAVINDPHARTTALRFVVIGVPVLTLWMVAAHAGHGAALDLGARRSGARPQRRRALRFGLYACGWDLMVGPLGALVTLVGSGWRACAELPALSMIVPGRSSLALLQGVYGLKADQAVRARGAGTAAAVVIAVLSGLGIVAAVLAAA
jgi:hypothetical protein